MGRPPSVMKRVAARLEADIATDVYRPGGSLPSDRKLSDALGANRATVRSALGDLARRGLVVRSEEGVTTVADRYTIIARASYDTARDEEPWRGFPPAVARTGDQPFTDVTGNAETRVPADAAMWLGTPDGTAVFRRDRVQGVIRGGLRIAVQLATTWYLTSLLDAVPEIVSAPDIDPAPVRRRMLDAERNIHYEHTVIGRHADRDERLMLRLPETAVVLDVWRLCVEDSSGEPVEVTRMVMDAKKAQIRY